MSLTRIDQVNRVDEKQAPPKVLEDLCRVLFDTQKKTMELNNECNELRQEIEEIRRLIR